MRVRTFEVSGELDAHAAEALALEIRRLAREHGVEVTITPLMEGGAPVTSSPATRTPPRPRRRAAPRRRRARAVG
jgi:hypothetical protein